MVLVARNILKCATWHFSYVTLRATYISDRVGNINGANADG